MEEFREFLLRWLDNQLIQMIISDAGGGRSRADTSQTGGNKGETAVSGDAHGRAKRAA